jgi:WD40 repeat protein
MLASAGDDRTVQLWDADTGAPVRTLSGHRDWVRGVAFAPDGQTLASASDDGTVRLWEVASGIGFVELLPLSEGGWATFGDGWHKLQGVPRGEFWYAINLCRFEPGELDPYLSPSRLVPADTPLAELKRGATSSV